MPATRRRPRPAAAPRGPISNDASFRIIAIAIVAVSGLFALLSPQLAAAIFLFGNVSLAVRRGAYFNPIIFTPTAISVILLVGGLNISTYRGDIYNETFAYIFYCILTLSAGAIAAAFLPARQSTRDMRGANITRTSLVIASAPGLIGIAWMVASTGIPLLDQSLRFSVPPKAMFLCEMFDAVAVLMAYRYCFRRSLDGMDLVTIGLLAIALLLPGYRNFIVVAALVAAIGLNRVGIIRPKALSLAISAVGVLVFLSIIVAFRRMTSSDLVSSSDSIQMYHVQYLPSLLAQVHFSFRESLALTQRLISTLGRWNGPSIFFADFKTMLPGQSESGGIMIAQMLGGAQLGGLTPGLVGVLTVEFGSPLCFAAFFLAGAGGAILWDWFYRTRKPEIAFLYGFFVVNMLLLFHRGIPKPTMIMVPLYFYALVVMFRFTGTARVGKTVRRTVRRSPAEDEVAA